MKDRSGNGTPGMEQQSEQDICAREVSNAECSSQGIRNVKVREGSENNNNKKNSANQKLKKKCTALQRNYKYSIQHSLVKNNPCFSLPPTSKIYLSVVCLRKGGGGRWGLGIEIRDTNLNQLSSVHYLYSWHNVQGGNYSDK